MRIWGMGSISLPNLNKVDKRGLKLCILIGAILGVLIIISI